MYDIENKGLKGFEELIEKVDFKVEHLTQEYKRLLAAGEPSDQILNDFGQQNNFKDFLQYVKESDGQFNVQDIPGKWYEPVSEEDLQKLESIEYEPLNSAILFLSEIPGLDCDLDGLGEISKEKKSKSPYHIGVEMLKGIDPFPVVFLGEVKNNYNLKVYKNGIGWVEYSEYEPLTKFQSEIYLKYNANKSRNPQNAFEVFSAERRLQVVEGNTTGMYRFIPNNINGWVSGRWESLNLSNTTVVFEDCFYDLATTKKTPYDMNITPVYGPIIPFTYDEVIGVKNYPNLNDFFDTFGITKDKQDFLAEATGRILISKMLDKKMVILYGKSNSGKSSFLSIIKSAIGSAATADIDLEECANRAFARTIIYSKSLITIDEWEQNGALKPSEKRFLKKYLGGVLTFEEKNGKSVSTVAVGKMFACSNKIPSFKNDNSGAMENRLITIEFDNEINPDKIDMSKADITFWGEKENRLEVLNWMFKGIVRLYAKGFNLKLTGDLLEKHTTVIEELNDTSVEIKNMYQKGESTDHICITGIKDAFKEKGIYLPYNKITQLFQKLINKDIKRIRKRNSNGERTYFLTGVKLKGV